ncbi:MAG: hypothetical protein V4801_05505 [Burkholderia gladioli]
MAGDQSQGHCIVDGWSLIGALARVIESVVDLFTELVRAFGWIGTGFFCASLVLYFTWFCMLFRITRIDIF